MILVLGRSWKIEKREVANVDGYLVGRPRVDGSRSANVDGYRLDSRCANADGYRLYSGCANVDGYRNDL